MLFDIETYVLQNSVTSSVVVKLLYTYSSTKDNSLSSILSEKLFRGTSLTLLMATFNISKNLL